MAEHGSVLPGPGGIGLRKMTNPEEKSRQINTGQCNWPDNSKRLPLPREDEQRDHISSSSQDEPATGKLLPASGKEGAREEPVHKRVKMQARGPDTFVVFAMSARLGIF